MQLRKERIIGIVYGENEKIVHHPDLEKYLEYQSVDWNHSKELDSKQKAFFADANLNLKDRFLFGSSLRYESFDKTNIKDDYQPSWQLSGMWKLKKKPF